MAIDLRLLPLPTGLKPSDLTLAIRVLKNDRTDVVKEDLLGHLRGDAIRLVLGAADLPPGCYIVEFLLQDAKGRTLTRGDRSLEIVPQG